jgi:hypothetical protein
VEATSYYNQQTGCNKNSARVLVAREGSYRNPSCSHFSTQLFLDSANPTLEEQPVRKRLVVAAVCILALPLLYPSQSEATNPSPYAIVALAGRTLAGGWCDCGTPGCICDPGEQPIGLSARPVSERNGRSLNQDTTSGSADRRFGFDLGSGALMLALAFFVWTRFRA